MRKFKRKYEKKYIKDVAILKLESDIAKKYGLRNKKQINIARQYVKKYQKLNRQLNHDSDTYKKVCDKLVSLGVIPEKYDVNKFYTLKVEHFLDRRLQTLVSKIKNITPSYARQLITHGKVLVNDKLSRFPSYLIRSKSIISFR